RADLLRGDHAIEARALDVEDLALQRQDRLGATVPALLGRATCRITLDDENLGERRVFLLAVGELPGQTGDVQRAFAARHLARLARRFARPRRVDDLADNVLGFGRVLEQELAKLLRHACLDRTLDL